MPLTSVTRQPGGGNNLNVAEGLADLRKQFEGVYISVFDDFLPYVAANYTATGTGSVAQVAGGLGGRINIISSAGGEEAIQGVLFPFTLDATKDWFFQTKVSLDDASLGGFFIGLSVVDTSPYASAPTDGVFLRKTAGAVGVTATLRSGGVDVATGLLSNPLTTGVMYDMGFAYTPQDGALRAFISNIGAVRLIPSAPMPVGPLAVNMSSFGAAARTLQADYVFAAMGR